MKAFSFFKEKKQMCFCIPDVTQINLLFRMASIICNLTNILSLSNARKGINGHYSHVYKLFHMTTYRFIVDLMVFWITIEYFCTNNSSHNFSYGWALRQIVAMIHIYVLNKKANTCNLRKSKVIITLFVALFQLINIDWVLWSDACMS